MATAAIVYRSRTGITRRFAEEIGAFLGARGIEAQVTSVGECDMASLASVDYLLLGCWTNGLMVVLQHPDQPWIDFARDLPTLPGPRVGLFTTYKLLTGSMFSEMRKHVVGKVPAIDLELKSRSGHLSEAHKGVLESFITPS